METLRAQLTARAVATSIWQKAAPALLVLRMPVPLAEPPRDPVPIAVEELSSLATILVEELDRVRANEAAALAQVHAFWVEGVPWSLGDLISDIEREAAVKTAALETAQVAVDAALESAIHICHEVASAATVLPDTCPPEVIEALEVRLRSLYSQLHELPMGPPVEATLRLAMNPEGIPVCVTRELAPGDVALAVSSRRLGRRTRPGTEVAFRLEFTPVARLRPGFDATAASHMLLQRAVVLAWLAPPAAVVGACVVPASPLCVQLRTVSDAKSSAEGTMGLLTIDVCIEVPPAAPEGSVIELQRVAILGGREDALGLGMLPAQVCLDGPCKRPVQHENCPFLVASV